MTIHERISCFVLISVALFACPAQTPADVANSHIEGNVPPGNLFDQYLKRDLSTYFCNGSVDCRVEYELLRKGATQTGIAYPKFYVWISCFQKNVEVTHGAARLAAIDRAEFRVTDFMTKEAILASPQQVGSVFPAVLVDNILKRARE